MGRKGTCCSEKIQGKEVSLQENSVDINQNEKFNYFVLMYIAQYFSVIAGFIVEVFSISLKVSKFQIN